MKHSIDEAHKLVREVFIAVFQILLIPYAIYRMFKFTLKLLFTPFVWAWNILTFIWKGLTYEIKLRPLPVLKKERDNFSSWVKDNK